MKVPWKILTIVTTLACLISFVNIKMSNETIENQTSMIGDLLNGVEQRNRTIQQLKRTFIDCLNMDGLKLNPNIKIAKNEMTLVESIIPGKHLVLRVQESNCNECVTYCLRSLEEMKGKLPNIILLSTYNDLDEFKRDHKTDFPIFNVKDLNIPFDQTTSPYLFMLDSDFEISSPFIPDKGYPDLFDQYLLTISSRKGNIIEF